MLTPHKLLHEQELATFSSLTVSDMTTVSAGFSRAVTKSKPSKMSIQTSFLQSLRSWSRLSVAKNQLPDPHDAGAPLVRHRGWGLGFFLLGLVATPAFAQPATVKLSQLCASGDCEISVNTTVDEPESTDLTTVRKLTVTGNFTVKPGVVLQFLKPASIRVNGNMVLAGIVGAPGHGGAGGAGGAAGQPGGAGGDAPAVVSPVGFEVLGSITLSENTTLVMEAGAGGDGGVGDTGLPGGKGGAGGIAGSLAFNTCRAFTSDATAKVVVNGGAGGLGQTGAQGGAGGAAGSVKINARQTIMSNALVEALGGAGGSGGSGAGAAGLNGDIILSALGTITVEPETLKSGSKTPSITASQASIADLEYCVPPAVTSVSPGSIDVSGGSVITINGRGFALGVTGVTINGAACTNVTILSDTQLTCKAPRGQVGPAKVLVSTPVETSESYLNFSYAESIPTLSEWAVILLVSLIAMLAVIRIRQKRAHGADAGLGQ